MVMRVSLFLRFCEHLSWSDGMLGGYCQASAKYRVRALLRSLTDHLLARSHFTIDTME